MKLKIKTFNSIKSNPKSNKALKSARSRFYILGIRHLKMPDCIHQHVCIIHWQMNKKHNVKESEEGFLLLVKLNTT